jgi:hypothetical protein
MHMACTTVLCQHEFEGSAGTRHDCQGCAALCNHLFINQTKTNMPLRSLTCTANVTLLQAIAMVGSAECSPCTSLNAGRRIVPSRDVLQIAASVRSCWAKPAQKFIIWLSVMV